MTSQGLDQTIEYLHFADRGAIEATNDLGEGEEFILDHLRDEADIRVGGERTVQFESRRIVYYWELTRDGNLFAVVVPGEIINERYRREGTDEFSKVRPMMNASTEVKSALERAIREDFSKRFSAQLSATGADFIYDCLGHF